jgi:hypothetical protein
MYPPVTQFETRDQLVQEQLDVLRARRGMSTPWWSRLRARWTAGARTAAPARSPLAAPRR